MRPELLNIFALICGKALNGVNTVHSFTTFECTASSFDPSQIIVQENTFKLLGIFGTDSLISILCSLRACTAEVYCHYFGIRSSRTFHSGNELNYHLFQDLPSHVRMIADFLNKPLPDELINRISEQCSFREMTKNRASYNFTEKKDSKGILRKGVVGDWKNYFTPEQNDRFEKEVLKKLKGSELEFDFEI